MGVLARLAITFCCPGCLLLADPPNEFASDGTSDSAAACEEDWDCPDGQVCDWLFNECEAACQDEDCPGGHACDTEYNVCDDYCLDNSDCRPEYRCCEYEDYDRGLCDFGDCLLR